MIYHKSFCYYSVVRQNVQSLIEEKDGCWVVDSSGVCSWRRPPCLIFYINIFLLYFKSEGRWLVNKKKVHKFLFLLPPRNFFPLCLKPNISKVQVV